MRPKTKKNCLYCGKEFFTYKRDHHKYCCGKCRIKNNNMRHKYPGMVNPLAPYVAMGISCKRAVTQH